MASSHTTHLHLPTQTECTDRDLRPAAAANSGDHHGRGPDGLLRPPPRRRPARHPGGGERRPPQPGDAGVVPLLLPGRRGSQGPAPAAVRRDRRPGRLQVPQGDIHPRPHRPRPLPPRPGRVVCSGPCRCCPPSSSTAGAGCRRRSARADLLPAAEPDAGLHEAEPGHVGRDVRDLHFVLLVGDGRRGQRFQGPEPALLRQATVVWAQEEALRRRALRGHCQRQPLSLLQEKEEQGEEDDPSAGNQLEDRRHPAGRILMEEVRPETHQGLPLPTGLLQVQHRERMPRAEARGARHRRPGDAGGDLRGRAPPHAGTPPGARRRRRRSDVGVRCRRRRVRRQRTCLT